MLAFTAAGLVVSALLLALTCFLPNGPPNGPPNGEDSSIGPPPVSAPPPPNGGDPLKAMAEALQGIEKSLSGARDLSITVKLDKDQWREIDKRLQNPSDGLTGIGNAIATGVEKIAGNTGRIATGVENVSNETGAVSAGVKDIAIGMKNVSGKVDAIAADVKKIVGNTGRIATGVENVSNKANAIASSVEGIATGVKNVSGKTDAIAADVKDIADGMGGGIVVIGGLGGMTRPWACREEPDKCLGVVHFPHNWPPEPDAASDKCEKWEWEKSGSKEPMREELKSIITELENKKLSQPVWIVGHASTLGTEPHNDGLSMRRAKFVACHLEEEETLEWDDNVHFKTCAVGVGERGSADSLRHPDAWYRVVQVFAKEPQAPIENLSWECSK